MLQRLLGPLALASMAITLWMIFAWAPVESAMGIVQKIMYLHVPTIWITFVTLFLTFLCSVAYLWKREERYDIWAYASAEIGVVFLALALLSGAIWGKPTWNTYWSWDARLTTTLILFLIFVGYLLLRRFVSAGEQQARISAIVAIIGFLDVPLIHQSVVWWRTLHQPSTMFSKKENVIDKPLLLMLWVSVAAFSVLYAWLLSRRVELETKHRQVLRHLANLD